MATFSQGPALTPLPAASTLSIADLYVRHLLAVPDDVDPAEIEALALSRFPATTWESIPTEQDGPAGPTLAPGSLRISRHTVISGPYATVDAEGAPLGFSHDVDMVYEVLCPQERGPAPYQSGGDRDGLVRVFVDGMPFREEGRVTNWLVAVARRLGGAVRFDVGEQVNRLVSPDSSASVDITVYTPVWLDPDAALAVCQSAMPATRPSSSGESYQGPTASTGMLPIVPDSPLTPEQLTALHRKADDIDIAALTAPRMVSAYAVEVDLGKDGLVSVEVTGIDKTPTVLRGVDWAQDGVIGYLIRWTPVDLVDWQREIPSFDHRVSRTRATGVVSQLGRVIFAAVGGEVTDQDEFLVDPEDI